MSPDEDIDNPLALVADDLVDPVSKDVLELRSSAALDLRPPAARPDFRPVGVTPFVLLNAVDGSAFPILDGIPVLMATERLVGPSSSIVVAEPTVAPFEESYLEQQLYTDEAVGRLNGRLVEQLARVFERAEPATFPTPIRDWHESGSAIAAYERALDHLAPIAGRTVLQVGGIGSHAVKFVHGGATAAIVMSPVLEELRTCRQLATRLGVAEQVVVLCGIAEQIPLRDGAIDRVYSGSSLHHTITELSFGEIHRILGEDGRMASIDVWRGGRAYDLGIRIFGKAGGNQFCKAFERDRIAPFFDEFDDARASLHGALARYPLAVGERFGLRPPPAALERICGVEDRVAARIRPLSDRLASLVCLTASA